MVAGKTEDEKGRSIVEMIRKKQIIDEFAKIWKAINEIKGSTKETSEDSNEIAPCELSTRSKIPVFQVMKK